MKAGSDVGLDGEKVMLLWKDSVQPKSVEAFFYKIYGAEGGVRPGWKVSAMACGAFAAFPAMRCVCHWIRYGSVFH